jgi:hypothetical protein
MRPGSDPGPVPAAPVDQVVPRFRTRPRVVRDLVGGKARRGTHLLRDLVHVRRRVLVGQATQGPFREPVAEGSAGFDRQLVERQVIGRHGKRFAQFRAPILGRLLLPGIDQVETHPGKGPSGDIEGLARFGHTVQPAEPPQIGVVQGLDAHGDTIDPASRNASNRSASTEVGFASSVISISLAKDQPPARRRGWRPTTSGSMSDGVPPPKKMLRRTRVRFPRNAFYFR